MTLIEYVNFFSVEKLHQLGDGFYGTSIMHLMYRIFMLQQTMSVEFATMVLNEIERNLPQFFKCRLDMMGTRMNCNLRAHKTEYAVVPQKVERLLYLRHSSSNCEDL